MSLLLIRTIYCIAINATAIETWEMERHEALLKRARRNGGLIHGPNGGQILLESHEFPYDIGIWENLVRAMGSRNVLSYFNMHAKTLLTVCIDPEMVLALFTLASYRNRAYIQD